jgi:hypothetical protein
MHVVSVVIGCSSSFHFSLDHLPAIAIAKEDRPNHVRFLCRPKIPECLPPLAVSEQPNALPHKEFRYTVHIVVA